MNSILEKNLDSDCFIRFCNASPKDITQPIFGPNLSPIEVINIFKKSNRTCYMFDGNHMTHLIIRPVVNIEYELRCFWHKHKLRAVSGPLFYVNDEMQANIKLIVNQFFIEHGSHICYNSCTIDLGLTNDIPFIIEINSFGLDMLASAELFKWEEDFTILYNSNEPIYKFKKEFEW
jgi:hypothetical protein